MIESWQQQQQQQQQQQNGDEQQQQQDLICGHPFSASINADNAPCTAAV